MFTCPCQQANHGSLSTTHAYSVTYPFDCVSLLSAFHRPKTIFPEMLATTKQKPNLEQSTSELSKCLTFLSDARIRWHCMPPNERVWNCGCQRCTDYCGFGSVSSQPIGSLLRRLHGLGLVALALPSWLAEVESLVKKINDLVVEIVVLECKKVGK